MSCKDLCSLFYEYGQVSWYNGLHIYSPNKNGEFDPMDPMTKMWVSLVAMLILGCSVFLITFARTKTKGVIRIALSLIAFLFMVVGFLGGVLSLT